MTAYLFGASQAAFTFGKKGVKRFALHDPLYGFLSVLLSAIALLLRQQPRPASSIVNAEGAGGAAIRKESKRRPTFRRSSLPMGIGGTPASTRSTHDTSLRPLTKQLFPTRNAPHGSLTLNIADAIGRGLRFNPGAISANSSVKTVARPNGWTALSLMLPQYLCDLV